MSPAPGLSVGIMSMQRILNYGSTLQAYSLRRLIERHPSVSSIRFLDYHPGPPASHTESAHTNTGLGRTLGKITEYGRGDGSITDKLRFLNHKRRYEQRYFPMVGIPDQRDYDTAVDIEVIGSDEVFNCVQTNTHIGYSRELFGHNSGARRLLSYAASFGNTTIGGIDHAGIRASIGEDLARFTHLSVRDENSQSIVKQLTGETPEIHVDPAIAFDLMSQEERIPRSRLHDSPYLVVYAYPGRLTPRENRALRSLADSRGWQILTFGGYQACGDRFIDCNPFELLAYFRDSEAVITDTFHGTIFAAINQRQFSTFIRRSRAASYGNEEKLGFLLRTLGLETREIRDLADLSHEIDTPIDWGHVGSRIAAERERTSIYLMNVIGGVDG